MIFWVRSSWGQAELWNVTDWKSFPSACLELQLTSQSEILSVVFEMFVKQPAGQRRASLSLSTSRRFITSRMTGLLRPIKILLRHDAEDADTFGCTHKGDMGTFSSVSVSLTGAWTHTYMKNRLVSDSPEAAMPGWVEASKHPKENLNKQYPLLKHLMPQEFKIKETNTHTVFGLQMIVFYAVFNQSIYLYWLMFLHLFGVLSTY